MNGNNHSSSNSDLVYPAVASIDTLGVKKPQVSNYTYKDIVVINSLQFTDETRLRGWTKSQ